MLVGGTDERHAPVTRRPIDGDTRLHQFFASRVDVVDFVGEVAEVARLAVVLVAVPVISELYKRRWKTGGSRRGNEFLVVGGREEYEREAALLTLGPARFLQAEFVTVEIERSVEIANAEHSVKKTHDYLARNV